LPPIEFVQLRIAHRDRSTSRGDSWHKEVAMYAANSLIGLLLGIVSGDTANAGSATEATEMVEVNHCYNRDTGERRFVQVIYWDTHDTPCLHVREWHMLDKCHAIYQVPARGQQPITVIRRTDCGGNVQIIRAVRCRVTHTYTDPEEEDRKLLPIDARRPLGVPR
jgi:hypothetical protein